MLLNCRQTPSERLTFLRLKKNIVSDFFFFCKWFSMILWSMMNDLMMHEMLWFSFWNYMICLHVCVNAWVEFALFFIFSFLHKSKKCWRSYAYVHVMNHWWCMTCYDFIFKLRWWCMRGCMNAWVNFALLKKMNYSCMHDLVWCMNFSFAFFWTQYSNWFPFHCYF